METGPRRSTTLPTQLLSMNSQADLYYWDAPCNIWFVALFMYTAATFLSLCTSRSGCTITLLLPRVLLVYVGRGDKKDSCAALYPEKVSSVSKEGTQPCLYHTVDSTYLHQASSDSSLKETLFIFKRFMRGKHSSSWCFRKFRNKEQPMGKAELRISAKSMTVGVFTDGLLKVTLL